MVSQLLVAPEETVTVILESSALGARSI